MFNSCLKALAKILDSWEESDFLGLPLCPSIIWGSCWALELCLQVKWRELLGKLCRQFRLTSLSHEEQILLHFILPEDHQYHQGTVGALPFLACLYHHDLSEWKALSFPETDLPKCHLPDEHLPTPTMTNIWLYNLAYDRPLALNFGSFFLIWVSEVQGQDFFIFVPRAWPHNRSSGYLWSTELMNSSFWWIIGYFNPGRCQEENMDPCLSWQPSYYRDNYSMGPSLGEQARSLPGCRQQIEGIKAGSAKTSSLKQPFPACYSQLKANEPE